MTLANVQLGPTSALLFADSLVSAADGSGGVAFTSKIGLHLHARCAWVMRGSERMADALRDALAYAPPDFDAAVAGLPDALRRARRRIVTDRAAAFRPTPDGMMIAEIFLAGWSRARGRMRLVELSSFADFAPVDRPPGIYLQPDPGAKVRASLPVALDLPALIRIADVQRDMMARSGQQEGRGVGIGGELHACELTADGARLRVLHTWPTDHDGGPHAA